MNKSLLFISRLTTEDPSKLKIPGYFVASTAPINIEGDSLEPSQQQTAYQAEQYLNEIAQLLYHKVNTEIIPEVNSSDWIEVIISIHGYNNSRKVAESRYKQILNYINNDNSQPVQNRAKNLLYIGYRWPSETISGNEPGGLKKKFVTAFTALPLLARGIFMGGIVGIILSMIPQVHQLMFYNSFFFITSIILLILMFLFFFVVSLIILRVVVYFRDSYRATNFAVPDLVEFIRQLDKAIANQVKEKIIVQSSLIQELQNRLLQKSKSSLDSQLLTSIDEQSLELICEQVVKKYCKDKTVNLKAVSFSENPVSSSSLKQVVETVVGILEQDPDAELNRIKETTIATLENEAQRYWNENNRIKLTFIGHSMGGYVVTTVVRLLSNVFDLSSVGTLSSTNKLPTLDIGRVFRLGRLVLISPDIPINTILSGRTNFLRSSLRRFEEAYLFSNERDLALRLASTVANYISFPARTRESGYRLGNVAIRNAKGYGIVNLERLNQSPTQPQKEILKQLFVDSFDLKQSLQTIQENYFEFQDGEEEEVASLFTYFDCTDYTDETIQRNSAARRVLSLKQGRWEPGLIYYLRLIVAVALGKRSTHGGYFDGKFSQQLMYRLAFLGFSGLLDSYDADNHLSALKYLSEKCRQKKIQVLLSPERYEVDILGRDREQCRRQMLNP